MIENFDLTVLQWVHPWSGNHWLRWLMIALTILGNGWVLVLLLPFIWKKASRRTALLLLGATLLSSTVVFVLKHSLKRIRPFTTLSWVSPIYHAPSDPSFPSGHAAGAFTFACFLFIVVVPYIRRTVHFNGPVAWGMTVLVALLFFSLASAIAFSRVYLGVHYPSDITIGATLGALIGTLFGRRAITAQSLAEQRDRSGK